MDENTKNYLKAVQESCGFKSESEHTPEPKQESEVDEVARKQLDAFQLMMARKGRIEDIFKD
jgi:hypothetical protein